MLQVIERSGQLPGGTSWNNDENTLYVTGLPEDCTTEALYRIFAPFGSIAPQGCLAMSNPDGSCKGFGFINYLEPGASAMAIETINAISFPDGSRLRVQIKNSPTKKDEDEEKEEKETEDD
mmetsp:Transcript_5758/g.13550  ORF Transcript_5758/g.13550 Transcript_5758/m.13550 type:complete len:121 (-) Transcript_5758:94-456(-)|eukprot:CAMPEP_0171061812 /NCGR_PEP_ID=MMETSP0766_2-20121228/4682_1 /TAXON_ID=439317 /ORGANISM="Gambierdiscus australes, Strain CAWD 149" /LENGTH=120 /DNA_ID=CAMNT_0011517541 /DNA_START=85 /DNA_END=447 /DNA_ORIENTATION=+